MNKAVMVGVGILVIACGSGVVQAAKPDPLAIVFEDKPLRRLLEELGGEHEIEDYDKALAALPRFCSKPERAIPTLTAALADKDVFVRVAAVQCLGYYCGTDAKALVPPLLKTLQTDEAGFVRAEAACSLSVVAPEDKTVLAALLKALKEDKDGKVRAMVIRRFRYNHGQYKKSPASIFPAVLEALKDPDDDVRIGAVFAVGEIGDPKITIPLLIDALKAHGVVGSNAPSALGDLCPAAIPALCEAMKDKAPGVRAGAVKALWYASSGRSGINARILKELPTIMALLDDKESNVRACAASTLGQIKAVAALPALTAKLDDVDWEVRRACISALGSIGPDAAAAVDKVSERLKNDREPLVRLEAAQALGSMGSKAKAAVPTLIEALKDKDADVVLWAANALGKIGPDAKAAIPQLKEASKAKDKRLRRFAKEALENIGAE